MASYSMCANWATNVAYNHMYYEIYIKIFINVQGLDVRGKGQRAASFNSNENLGLLCKNI